MNIQVIYSPKTQTIISNVPTPYIEAQQTMEERVRDIINGDAPELVWFLQHPALYTAGSSAKPDDLLSPTQLPVFETRRGGQYTYHGPGQRIIYLCLNLKQRTAPYTPDIRQFIKQCEAWVISTLAHFGINGETREGRIGIWVTDPEGHESKIAAIGVHVKQWVTSHGIAINLNPDLTHFQGIVPCGIKEYGVTSMHQCGVHISLDELDAVLLSTFEQSFFC